MISTSLLKKQRRILLLLVLLILLTGLTGLSIGSASLSYAQTLLVLIGHGNPMDEFVILDIRMPRLLITLLSGMALAASGAILQNLSRNDLADPGVIGINSGAGVAVAIYFLFAPVNQDSFTYILPIVAFIGAFITACLIYGFSYTKNASLEPIRFILVGVGFSLALSGLMIVIISSSDKQKVNFIASWLAGTIWGDGWPFILAVLPWLLVLIPFTLYKAQSLNLLSLHDTTSIGLGLPIQKERLILLAAAVGLAASSVSVTGNISFIGIMAPHLAKALVGPRSQLYIPIAVLIGGFLLMTADLIGHNIVPPDGIPAGIIVSLIGAPYFIYLFFRQKA
jgi:iron complex transport system permease protein